MKKEFKSESKQLLNLMIHSIYSNKDIFLRELLSNASDALDKKEFFKAQSKDVTSEASKIIIDVDAKSRTITLTDTGIGMNEEELEQNLGTIAHSGSKAFIEQLEENQDADIIGQFGVGFYSSFIVADTVTVVTKTATDSAYKWTSDGVEAYEIEASDSDFIGTKITLHIKKGTDFDQYLNEDTIKSLVKKHSDYVKYPIQMLSLIESDSDDENTPEAFEYQTINSQIAIWKKDKKDITTDEYNQFYTQTYFDFMPPLKTIHAKMSGATNLEMLVYLPKQKAFDYQNPTFKKGLDLYCRGVLIDNTVDYLLPDYFNFARGLIDSEDLNLNISREMLQQDKIVDKLKKAVSSRIKKELLKIQKKDRSAYEEFYDQFGRTLMFGVYDNYGAYKDELKDLIMFKSSIEDKYVTLSEYIEKNVETKEIYYIAGTSIDKIKQMPIMEKISGKNIEVLYLTNDVDEFALQGMQSYQDYTFKSILTADLDTEDEKKEIEKLSTDNKEILEKIKTSLDTKVSNVRLTTKLENVAVCVVNDNEISIEQEKILAQMPDNQIKIDKVLEINPKHALFKALEKSSNPEKYSQLLLDQALLIEGLAIENPKAHAELLNELIIEALKN